MRRFAIEVWGVRTAVEWEHPSFDSAVSKLLLPIWQDRPGLDVDTTFSLLGRPEDCEVRGPSLDPFAPTRMDPVETLERRLHLHLASQTDQVVYVHAGVVTHEGRAIVIPGRSWTGKSRLVVALIGAGATYMSDEYAIIDRQGLVHPFPRPVSLREAKGNRRIAAEELGWLGCAAPVPLCAVICTRFSPGTRWHPEPIGAGAAVLELVSNTVSAQAQPKLALECLSATVKGASCYQSERGEAEETASLILEELRSGGCRGSDPPS